MPLHLPYSIHHPRSLSFSFASNLSTLPKIVITKTPSRSRIPRIVAFTSNDIKAGKDIIVDGAPWRVLEFLHVKPGKGAAFVRTKIRNHITGSTVEKTFRAGITVEEADVFKDTKQYSYKDGSQYVFMDLTTYEESRVNEEDVGDKKKFLKEGMECNLLYWKGRVIDFELPITVQLTVVDTEPGVKGDTVAGTCRRPHIPLHPHRHVHMHPTVTLMHIYTHRGNDMEEHVQENTHKVILVIDISHDSSPGFFQI